MSRVSFKFEGKLKEVCPWGPPCWSAPLTFCGVGIRKPPPATFRFKSLLATGLMLDPSPATVPPSAPFNPPTTLPNPPFARSSAKPAKTPLAPHFHPPPSLSPLPPYHP